MMHIRRVLALAITVAALTSAPALVAQQNNEQQDRREQEQQSQQEQRDIQALVQMVDAAVEGTQPAPADIGLQWQANHFMRGAEGLTYVPFILAVDAAQLAAPDTALYVRAISKNAAAEPDPAGEPPAAGEYAWDDVNFVDVQPDGKLSRAMLLEPGEFEVFVAIKEASPLEEQNSQPPAKAALLRRDITVPDFTGTDLTVSSVLIGAIAPLPAPLTPEQQEETPYTFGQLSVAVSTDFKLKKSGELNVVFWVYGAETRDDDGLALTAGKPDVQDDGLALTAGKPDVQIEYNFHQRTAEGETYFNKAAPQLLNASTLPPQFDSAIHQLTGLLLVPLASFPVGEYRLEITVTDQFSGETLTHNENFTVEA